MNDPIQAYNELDLQHQAKVNRLLKSLANEEKKSINMC